MMQENMVPEIITYTYISKKMPAGEGF